MISTRLHGVIDYAVAALFGGLAASRALTPETRRTIGTAGAYHASYAAVTDYEAGLRPWIGMRQHLLLDAIGALALCGIGAAAHRRPSHERALLIAAGLAELAVVTFSQTQPKTGPGGGASLLDRMLPRSPRVGYPPLDMPKPVADCVFVIDSLLPGLLGRMLPARMTAVVLPDGGLLLHSPTRFSPALRQALEGIGPIRHLVAPSFAHWTFVADWQRACPDATTWATPGLRERRQVRRSGLRLDHDLGDSPPAAWGGAIALITLPGGLGFHETALFHRPSRTLLLTDLVLNVEAWKAPALARPLLRLFGATAPDGMPPPYLRAVIKLRHEAAAAAARRLLEFGAERVIFAHGRWFDRDAPAHLRHSLRWLLDQYRSTLASTGMRAGLVGRPRAKSKTCQPAFRPRKGQRLSRLV